MTTNAVKQQRPAWGRLVPPCRPRRASRMRWRTRGDQEGQPESGGRGRPCGCCLGGGLAFSSPSFLVKFLRKRKSPREWNRTTLQPLRGEPVIPGDELRFRLRYHTVFVSPRRQVDPAVVRTCFHVPGHYSVGFPAGSPWCSNPFRDFPVVGSALVSVSPFSFVSPS